MTVVQPFKEASAARLPERCIFEGRVVRLEPLNAVVHGDALFKSTQGQERDGLWKYLFEGPFPHREDFVHYLTKAAASDDPLFFAIVNKASGLAVGWAAFLRFDPLHRVIEVGHILYTPQLQRTVGATEAMYLMARYVFEELSYRRYEWKCNSLNKPSLRAARRLGFTFEGIFRQHMIVKGLNRDTAWFSMLDSEWPRVKANLERWLAPANFDADGQQRTVLTHPDSNCST